MKIRAFFKKWHEYCPIFTIVTILLFPIVLSLHILSIYIEPLANFVNRYPAAVGRFLLAKLTGFLPFSLGEVLLLLLVPIVITLVVVAFRLTKKEDPKPSRYFLSGLLSLILCLYFGFVFTLGTSYFTTTLDKELDLNKHAISAEELFAATETVINEMNALLDEIEFDENGMSIMPYSRRELNRKLNDAYKAVSARYGVVSKLRSSPKAILLSEPLTYTHLSGVYSYFTGEANVNVNFPTSVVAFTTAHEMAHQRGFGREDESNFIAFLVCMASDDPYIRYSGYYEMFKYLINALYTADTDLFNEAYRIADDRLVNEIVAFNDFYEKYLDNKAGEITSDLNDAYQQMQGIEAGVQSYGLVVDLAVAYHEKYGRFGE